jgi:hypothetical protein
MNRLIRCDCGHEICCEDTAELIERARDHARKEHHMELTAAHILAVAQPCETTERSDPTWGGRRPDEEGI